MSRHVCLLSCSVAIAIAAFCSSSAQALDIVRDRKPVAVIVAADTVPENVKDYGLRTDPKRRPSKKGQPVVLDGPDAEAAKLLADWIKKMTGAEVTIVAEAPKEGPAIFVGLAAQGAGLKVDDIDSPSHEGVRIKSEKNRVLLSGQSQASTKRAVARFLETFGCRVFMDGEIGEVYPDLVTLEVGELNITEKPFMVYRNPKGPSWGSLAWKTWNGAGGSSMNHSHGWGAFVSKELYEKHPEYYSMRAGERKESAWICTSNSGLRTHVAETLNKMIEAGSKNPSLSPSDGTNFCQCDACKAQDIPNDIEPSSGTVSMSNRYVDFFDDVAKRVYKTHPDSILSFYCYSDYTQPPVGDKKLSPNLCAFIAPIRYCRLHGIGTEYCEQRTQQKGNIEGWAKIANKLGYYMYMYDLAETTVPVCMLARLKQDMPYLADRGCVGMTQEVLTQWHLYGPHIHLGLKLMYDPKADADAIMDDYFQKFYGSAAAPMEQYWNAIDEAVTKVDCHAGSFFWIQEVYTPEFLSHLDRLLKQAADAAKGNAKYTERVEMARAGYQSAVDYTQMRNAMIAGDFVKAKEIYDGHHERLTAAVKKGWANPEYASGYMKRFNGATVEMGHRLTTGDNHLLAVLPDKWHLTYEKDLATGGKEPFDPQLDDAKWQIVSTYEHTLSGQNLPDRQEVAWYRTTFDLKKKPAKLSLFFGEIDGLADVYVNGKKVELVPDPAAKPAKPAAPPAPGAPPTPTGFARRKPFEVDITAAAVVGKNQVTVKSDHLRITELNLGGIIRPVYLIEKGN